MLAHMKRNLATTLAGLVLAGLVVTGCASTPQPEAIATPDETTAPAPTADPVETTDPPAAPVGTRENPVPVGQVLAFSATSAFQVGASGPTLVTPGYSVLPLVIQIDWANIAAQNAAQGQANGDPFNPWSQYKISFVTAGGKSYETMDDYTAEIPNQLYDLGDVYEGTNTVNVNVPVSVPESELAGGAWAVENYASGARVFIAPQ